MWTIFADHCDSAVKRVIIMTMGGTISRSTVVCCYCSMGHENQDFCLGRCWVDDALLLQAVTVTPPTTDSVTLAARSKGVSLVFVVLVWTIFGDHCDSAVERVFIMTMGGTISRSSVVCCYCSMGQENQDFCLGRCWVDDALLLQAATPAPHTTDGLTLLSPRARTG